jgi:peroxiredoxin
MASLHVQGALTADTGPNIGKYAPPFELKILAGKTISLASLRWTVVLLDFWSTVCAPCVAEMPSLNRLSAASKESNLRVIAVSIDASDEPVREYAVKDNIAFTILLDKDKEVFSDQYAGPGLPATYLIDQNGIIVEKFNGSREWDTPDMKNRVLKLLERR